MPVSPGDYPHIALERALTRERLMELQYDEVEMIVDAPTTRIPLEEFQREETEAIFYLTYPRLKQASVKVCYEILPYLEVVELFAVDSLLLNMVMQLFPEVQLHSWQGRILESTAKSEQKDISICRRMHVCRNSSGIFIYVLKKKGLHFACTYEVDNPTDALYFVLFTWKKLDFNAHEDLCILHDYDELADELGVDAGVVTFSTHPDALVHGTAPRLINTFQDRDILLKEKYHRDPFLLPFSYVEDT